MADQVKAGWYPHAESPSWVRWWDGSAWSDAYWPTQLPGTSYLPTAIRLNISAAGEPRFDIVGENWREAEILAAIGRSSTPRDVEFEGYGEAELVPEPDNPHDPNAISVRIDGHTVGYLPSESAKAYFAPLGRLTANGIVPTVRARVWGVTRWTQSRGRDELKSAIRLALPGPDEILPSNGIPQIPHAIVPSGRVLQATGEDAHLDKLSGYLGLRGKPLLASLHPIAGKSKGSEVVEIRFDGDRVGQLTPATSASLLPMVHEASAGGLTTFAWATVSGSRLAAEVKLRAVRAEDISDDWPTGFGLPPVGASSTPPPAYAPQVRIDPAPSPRGLPTWGWVLAVILALLLATIPYVGWALGLGVVAATVWWHLSQKRKAPSTRYPTPTF